MCKIILLSRFIICYTSCSLLDFFYYFNLSMDTIVFVISYNTQKYNISLKTDDISYFRLVELISKYFNIKKNMFYITTQNPTTILINQNNLIQLIDYNNNKITLEVNERLNGGFSIGSIFGPIINPIITIGRSFLRLGEILETFFLLFYDIMRMIPLIFDPPRLIDDIMFAVSYGINRVFNVAKESASGAFSSPEDDKKPKGPFGVDDDVSTTCIDPTFSTILLLIICPPLAIFYKLGFWKGFISAIICGVLCVKLYYFPGLLFAILHVLC